MGFRIGVDIGGTFTDFTVVDEQGGLTLWKEDSTPDDPVRAIAAGLPAVAQEMGMTLEALLGETSLFVHGSTIATNTVIQRSGARVGLVCTEGFRDAIYFRDGFKWERFNMHLPRPEDFAERWLRLGVRERVNYAGEVVKPLDEDGVRAVAARFREANVEAVGVAFLWSVVNDAHERRAAEILTEELPGVPILQSAEVLPEIREWERTSATVLGAYVSPKIGGYLRRLEQLLADNGAQRKPLIMQINGGCASVDEIMRRPVYTLASGPAAAPAAGLHYADKVQSGNLITIDMGGTSLDVALIRNGRPAMSRAIEVERQPIGVPGVEVHSIGAGGGSIGWIDSGGALRVGPQSAGSRPGPACYDQGGTEPTVTDANLVLGYLEPEAFLGGRRTLRGDLSEQAVRTRIAEPLGLTAQEAAAGMIELVDSNMVDGIRAISVERGIDPRSYVLVSGGGAGGLHAARLARALGMNRVLIPREASTFCSFGMTVTDVRHDYTRSGHYISDAVETAELDAMYAELEEEARARLRDAGFADEDIHLERSVDARYPNQVHELTVPIPSPERYGDADLRTIEATFHEEHDQNYTYSIPEMAVEFLHWRLTARGRMDVVGAPADPPPVEDAEALGREAVVGEREVFLVGQRTQATATVYRAELLKPGATAVGPAIVQSPITTVVLGPGDRLTADGAGSLMLDVAIDPARAEGAVLSA